MLFEIYFIFMLVNLAQCQTAFEWEGLVSVCNFFDTVNITGGLLNSDDSITFDSIRFAKENYKIFEYIYLPNQVRIPVEPHIRGCLCEYRSCVRLCCSLGYSSNLTFIKNLWYHNCVPNDDVTEFELISYLHLDHYTDIAFVSEIPCYNNGFWLDLRKSYNQWKVLPKGLLIRGVHSKPLIVDHDNYCIAQSFDHATLRFQTNVMFCINPSERVKLPSKAVVSLHYIVSEFIFPIVILTAAIIHTITFSVYCWIEELRTPAGKIFMCYLAMVITGDSVWSVSQLSKWYAFKGSTSCVIMSEIIHTAYIAGFVWLCIRGYDIWRTVNHVTENEDQFLKFCLFACGTTFVIVLITNILDHVHLLDKRFRPGFGILKCWLNAEYAYTLYYYPFIMIVVILNSVFFILSKLKIDRTRKLSNDATNIGDSRKFSCTEIGANRVALLFRLAIVLGLPYYVELLGYFISLLMYYVDGHEIAGRTTFFIIYSISNALHGPCVFHLYVNKPRIKRLLKVKWLSIMSSINLRTSLLTILRK